MVVLGCRVEGDGTPSAALARRIERAHVGFVVGQAPRIVASGGRRWRGLPEAEAIRRVLVAGGVDPRAVSLELRSNDTLENARFASALVRRSSGRRIAVVTCDWHMPRALACFRVYGFDAEPWPAPSPPPPWGRRVRRRLHEAVAWPLQRLRAAGDASGRSRAEALR